VVTDSNEKGIRRLIKAAGYSFKGLAAAFRHETAFKQEVVLSPILILLALWLGEGGVEQALLIMSWLLVLMFELVNSGIEAVVDRVGTEHHELSGRAIRLPLTLSWCSRTSLKIISCPTRCIF
jgi:diacylglycerol kinase (ATP)